MSDKQENVDSVVTFDGKVGNHFMYYKIARDNFQEASEKSETCTSEIEEANIQDWRIKSIYVATLEIQRD